MPLSVEHADVRDFVAYLHLKNLSSGTIAHYEWALGHFFRACPSDLTAPAEVRYAHLRDYVAGLQAENQAAKTVADRVSVLKRFFGYLYAEGRITVDPSLRLPTPKVGKRLPRALTLEETEAFFSVLSDTSAASTLPRVRRRDRVLFELMYAGGLRVSEAVGLRVMDVDFAVGSLRVIGKGDKERRIYLKPRLLALLREYIETEGLTDFLFPGRGGTPLSVRNVQLRIKKYAAEAGITRRVTPHTLRHSIAVHYLQGGAPVNFVQGLLGHANLSTTGKYLQLTDQMAKEITLETETALDRRTASDGEERVKERPAAYRTDGKVDWDAQVAVVMEWLAGEDSHAGPESAGE